MPISSQKHLQQGFTLIEIAIVLIIIGLLLGGAFKGLELVNNAKAKNIAADFRNISTFVYAYQDRFRALPGDDRAVAEHLSGAQVAAPERLGNARIDGAWNSSLPNDESFLVWQHLRLAGLTTGALDTNAADYKPKNAVGGVLGITSDPVLTNPSSPYFGGFFVCSQGISGRFARQVDTLLDDGSTQTGAVRALADNASTSNDALLLGPQSESQIFTLCMSF